MNPLIILWDLDDDSEGNVAHIAEHGITKDEVADVLNSPETIEASESSGRPIAFGYSATGRFIAVVYDEVDDDTVYPVTAYIVPEGGEE